MSFHYSATKPMFKTFWISVSIAIRKGIGRTITTTYRAQPELRLRSCPTGNRMHMFHISLTHNLFLGNHIDPVNMDRDFLPIIVILFLICLRFSSFKYFGNCTYRY